MSEQLEKILYAEDEPEIRDVATIALEAVGSFKVRVCNDGEEAVAAATEYRPDLLLFDVMMPNMDGPTAMKTIHKIPGMETVPTIFMTAKAQTREVANYKELGAIAVIHKPFDPMTLAESVRDLWSKRGM